MYAIVADGGSQHKVTEGESVLIDRKELAAGDPFEFERVLLYSDGEDVRVGTPTLDNVRVIGEVRGEELGEKLRVVKYRRRKNSRTRKGHRQKYLKIAITEIEAK